MSATRFKLKHTPTQEIELWHNGKVVATVKPHPAMGGLQVITPHKIFPYMTHNGNLTVFDVTVHPR